MDLDKDRATQLGELVGLLAEPTRLRILFALLEVANSSVGEVASTLEISDDAASYNLKILRLSGLVTSRRSGRSIIYSLNSNFPHQLLEHCLKQLLGIAETRSN